ncbi:hypothetical protein NGF19_20435 [Streptomyces sp. RY43-2]|uniref:Uncharacterized protein n=1 Tax=Streptomyces macrolidinus TaxID=2952607 RepID=A0ABT0ZHV4_9ACTN|nr:hypothetical protein [Streptomyces macrolidinus]MCN9243135.1 hypothetical protein [Streptomyces macrolidinus]
MSPGQQPRITRVESVSYRSISCRIGTHHACTESATVAAPIDLPVVYEVCDCSCHSMFNQPAPVEVER